MASDKTHFTPRQNPLSQSNPVQNSEGQLTLSREMPPTNVFGTLLRKPSKLFSTRSLLLPQAVPWRRA